MNSISRILDINISREDKSETRLLYIVGYYSNGGMNHDGI